MTAPSIVTSPTATRDGVALCARYALGPNRLHLCGPDMNQEVLAYINAGAADQGLTNILQEFNTLFPYLQQIAHANQIKYPFDRRVVEAYWLGNKLLEAIPVKTFYRHLTDNLRLNQKTPASQFAHLTNKLTQGALMHHCFHVLNVWPRTSHAASEHTLTSLDKCRISWGKVLNVDGPILTISRRPLITQAGKLALGSPGREKIYRRLEASTVLDNIKPNDTITIHWDIPCEIITPRQLVCLKQYTNLSLQLANQTF